MTSSYFGQIWDLGLVKLISPRYEFVTEMVLRSLCVYLFTKKNSDEIVRYPRCIPPWNSMIATNSAIETSRSTWTTESQEPVPTASMVLRYDPTNLRRRNLDATVNIDAKSRLDPPAWSYKRPFLRSLQSGWAKQPETRLNGLKKVR